MSLLETVDASGTPHLFSSAGNVCDICMINEYFIESICTDGWYRPTTRKLLVIIVEKHET